MAPAEITVELGSASLDSDRSTVWHCIASVDHDIEQKLLKLRSVTVDQGYVFGEVSPDLDVRFD